MRALFNNETRRNFIFPASAVIIILTVSPVFSQERTAERGNLWIYGGVETAMYSISGAAFGGGLTLMYGGRASMGFRAVYFADLEELLNILELNLLLRFFFMDSYSGPFIQLSGGPAFFFRQDGDITIPAYWGMMSAGLTLGWRFFFGRMFAEPFIRGGYPYIAGAGLSAGIRF